ncbi:acyl-CoA thioesterase [Holophaga foetida]|uniref:acyl-CoA thioesterase n=1 Tax=Holophaga foetida TaxID=35839 RepID=UPI0002471C9F|nr:thioesterase family protein [Holophaga foetida]
MKSYLRSEITLEVPFHDVDSMGIVWHGHYVKYLEIARTALIRSIGLDIPQMEAVGSVWPIVSCEMKYVRPLRYGQSFRVRVDLLEHQNRIKMGYLLTDAASGEVLNRATTVQVAVKADTGELIFETPSGLFDHLELQDLP